MCNALKNMTSLNFVNSVDAIHVEGVSVNLQVYMVHCGTVPASPSRLVILLSSSLAKHSGKLMVILVSRGQISDEEDSETNKETVLTVILNMLKNTNLNHLPVLLPE